MEPKFIESITLLFVLLNPFLMSIYLLDLIQELSFKHFARVLVRAGLISFTVFAFLAWAGDELFTNLLGVRYAAFVLFGGIIFLIIGLRFIFQGSEAIRSLRGDAKHLSGSIALPFMIGPGTVNASILAGANLPIFTAILSIFISMILVVLSLIILTWTLDYINNKNSLLIERYIDIVGRLSSLLIGTIAIDMCMQAIELWISKIKI